jgi:predicted phosphodiesterase
VRVLFLSDIHANLEALEACLAAAPPHDVVVNLGDTVGYGANPNEVIERARELGNTFVRGNHDRACAGLTDVRGFNYIAAAAAIWTNRQLSPENLEWLKNLPHGPVSLPDLPNVQMVHGSPRDEDEYLLLPDDAAASAALARAPVTFFGHTHMQGCFRITEKQQITLHPKYSSNEEAESWSLALENGGVYLINPGSVGQPRDGDWRAAFALLDSELKEVTYFRVPYDLATAQKKIVDANLPERLASRLQFGR